MTERRGFMTAIGIIGILIGLLLVLSGQLASARLRTDRSLAMLSESERRLAVSDALAGQLTTASQLLRTESRRLRAEVDQLAAITPTERIIVQPCEESVTPAFPRSSKMTGSGH